MKERKVFWFLFPIIAIASGVLLYKNVASEAFYSTLLVNFIFIILLLLVVFLYSKLKLKVSINDTFGLGDGLMFIALIFTFSSVTFLVLFVFGLIFSLALHLILKNKAKHTTVPLAGYLSLFFCNSIRIALVRFNDFCL